MVAVLDELRVTVLNKNADLLGTCLDLFVDPGFLPSKCIKNKFIDNVYLQIRTLSPDIKNKNISDKSVPLNLLKRKVKFNFIMQTSSISVR